MKTNTKIGLVAVLLAVGAIGGVIYVVSDDGPTDAQVAVSVAAQEAAKAKQAQYDKDHPEEVQARIAASQAAQAAAITKQAQRLTVAHAAVEIKHMMKDPDSFKLKSAVLMADGSACYTYSATNTFGGRMEEYGVLTPTGKILLNDPTPYNKFCAGKTGHELVGDQE